MHAHTHTHTHTHMHTQADALTAELRRLQEHVEGLNAEQVQANVSALNEAAQRITEKLQAAVGKMKEGEQICAR